MSLVKLRSAPFLLIEDGSNTNILPLLLEIVQDQNVLNIFCYEQPVAYWKNVFKEKSNIAFHEEYEAISDKYPSNNTSVIIDSANQMALSTSWNEWLKNIKILQSHPKVTQLIMVLHKDCLSHLSKLQLHLNHLASAIVSYDDKDPYKIRIQLKKTGKVFKCEEMLTYDSKTNVLKSIPIVKEDKKGEEVEKPLPSNLSTFKIEVDQTEKLEKYKLKLPYMSKINEGESKVYYEPDAVDDWDEEDPDEDLDI